MRDALLAQYERELSFLRRSGAEFGQRYPKIASRLLLEPTKCDDPHVERLLEGFAFLAARVQLRIEDDFPEFSESLLEVIYPHYVRPIPSMSLVQFHLDPDHGKIETGVRVPREALLHSRPVGGVPCRFRCCYDTTLWPIEVAGAKWTVPYDLSPPIAVHGAVGALRVDLRAPSDMGFGLLQIDSLRLHLSAEANVAGALYELLCNNCVEIVVRDPTPGSGRSVSLPPSALRPVGFGPDEGMLPYSKRSFVGYRLLQEYFTFPQKFFFLDLDGFDQVRAAGFGSRAEVVFLISSFERPDRRAMLEASVTADTIRLNCSPIVNLFPQTAEPVLLDHRREEYLLVPDARQRRSTGIYSVDEVVAITPDAADPVPFEPFYSLRHRRRGSEERFWHARRRPVEWRVDEGTDVFLSFLDPSGVTARPNCTAVTARLTCHNGDLPSRLNFGNAAGDFELPGGGPIRRIVALVKPTAAIHPALGTPQLWRLISQLSLNYTSLVADGPDALKELLRLHNFGESASAEAQIQGIVGVRGGASHSRVQSEFGLTFARGQRVEIEFDEEQFAGGSAYLLAAVLEHFLALAVSMNSFSTLVARTRQRRGLLAEWPPRAGWKTLPLVAALDALERELDENPTGFGFFQAVLLLERMRPGRGSVGVSTDPSAEVVRFATQRSISFPASEIHALDVKDEGPSRMTVNFMGLTGPQGVLPYHYTLLSAERARARDAGLADFLDLFHHRMISLFFRAWRKNRFVARRGGDEDSLREHLFDLVGMGLDGARSSLPFEPDALAFYSGLLSDQNRSAVALQQLLEDYFEVPIEVKQFVGGWYGLPERELCALGEGAGPSAPFGLGAVVGDEVWDPQSRIRIRVGPLDRTQYQYFLPTGEGYGKLREITRFFGNDQYEFDAQLVLAADEVPGCTLGSDDESPQPLGWSTWIRSAPFPTDADETILRL